MNELADAAAKDGAKSNKIEMIAMLAIFAVAIAGGIAAMTTIF